MAENPRKEAGYELMSLIKSGANLVEVVSYERERIYGFIHALASEMNLSWYRWTIIDGLEVFLPDQKAFQRVNEDPPDPIQLLKTFRNMKSGLVIAEDFHTFMDSSVSPEVVRYLREIAVVNRKSNKALIICNPIESIPNELLKEMPIVHIPLPTAPVLKIIAETSVKSFNLPPEKVELSDKLIQAALGLTIMEAKLAFNRAIFENGKLTDEEIPIIINEKGNLIKKRGILEYIHPKEQIDNIGGMDTLKEWLRRRGKGFSEDAKKFGIDYPRGVLLLGVPGCGKSLSAKAVANAWKFPLLRFDLGKVYGGLVGESEANIRYALDVAKALAPCVLWIDEIEKGLSGVASSNQTDSGVSARVFGTFLTWMQEKEEPVFVVATANDVGQIPTELLRKGRFDEIFFVDIPTLEERMEIFGIHLKKKGRDPDQFDLKALAEKSEGFTGAEIEECIRESLFVAFDKGSPLTDEIIMQIIEKTIPLSRTRSEYINQLRKWALYRATFASSKALKRLTEREIDSDKMPKLKQEIESPFIY